MSRGTPQWTDVMAHRISRQVRRSARLSWVVAAATVLGAGTLVLAPRPVEGPDLPEIGAVMDAPPATRIAVVDAVGDRPPVRVHLDHPARGVDTPVEIRF